MLSTEKRNNKTTMLDDMSIREFLKIMNEEDQSVPKVISRLLGDIEDVVSWVVEAFNKGGRLIYIGAGTSGRIGVIDAVECVPTFGVPFEQVRGLIAGGDSAFVKAVEGAEDSEALGKEDLENLELNASDIVIGLAASGRTPYVIGGLKYANEMGVRTVAISCNKSSLISSYAKKFIEVEVGPEVITGSTRLKAGTAQKLVLNMISTASMVAIGKTYGNLMVDVMPTNEKLVDRAKRIIMEATECDYNTAEKYYELSGGKPKTAIVMLLTGRSKEDVVEALKQGFVKKAIEALS